MRQALTLGLFRPFIESVIYYHGTYAPYNSAIDTLSLHQVPNTSMTSALCPRIRDLERTIYSRRTTTLLSTSSYSTPFPQSHPTNTSKFHTESPYHEPDWCRNFCPLYAIGRQAGHRLPLCRHHIGCLHSAHISASSMPHLLSHELVSPMTPTQ